MATLILTSGAIIRLEEIRRAEYYPLNSLDDYGCYLGGPENRRTPFLYLETTNGVHRITGNNSKRDLATLENAGVVVIRHRSKDAVQN